jgi:SAM-dependent methyltransferase
MGNSVSEDSTPPVCDYEGSDYQTRFWEKGGRAYEDRCEALALRQLLPKSGHLMLELGAGAGRNTSRYTGYERIVLVDYSRTQLKQAQERLGRSGKYIYVVGDIYRLPLRDGLFDAATMIRTLHHMADAPAALAQVRATLRSGAIFVLEYANKRNLKAILRFFFSLQTWNPFTREQVEFTHLNFDFHPGAVRDWLKDLGFRIERTLTVSHFRIGWLKRIIPPGILAGLDFILQWTGALVQFTPSVFLRARVAGEYFPLEGRDQVVAYFKCPTCGSGSLDPRETHLICLSCRSEWSVEDGIYIFKD